MKKLLIGLLMLAFIESAFPASNTIFSQTLEPNPDTGDELMIDKALDGPTRKITIGSLISGQTLVTAVGADSIMIIDATDSELRKALVSDVLIAPTITGILTVNQDSSAEAMKIEKTTTDGGMINFSATADADTTSAISTLTTSGATTHHIQVEINGVKAWIAVSTNDPT